MFTDRIESDVYPLTPLQQGMLLHSVSAPHSGVYIQQLVCEFHEALNVPHFRAAWQRVVDRHSVLRTDFNLEDPREPHQEVLQNVLLPFEEQDWRAAGSADAAQRFEVYLREDRRRGITLGRPPLWRMSLLRLAEHDYRLVWTSHHALMDGRSRRLVLQEVFALYEAFCRGSDLSLEPPRPFGDYVRWLAAQDCDASEGYWKRLLADFSFAPPLPMARSCPTELGEEDCHGTLELWLTEELTAALQSMAEACQVTWNTLLQGAWALLLSFYSGTEDVVFGATRACRRSSVEGMESMIGLLINTLPVRVRVPASESLLPWLKELRSQWVALREHEHTPLGKVQAWSDVPPGKPLFESLVVFENYRLEEAFRKQADGRAGRRFHLRGITNYPLVLAGYLGPRLLVELTYDRRRFADDTIERTREHLQTLLEGIADNPRRTLGELPILSSREHRQIVVEWNDTAAALPRDDTIPRLFEAQAARAPQATALVFADSQWTYQELNVRANRLAHHSLRTMGVGLETPVAICVERSPELIIGLLAILKAGGAYVPLDPAYPKERLRFILRDTRAPVLLTQSSLIDQLPEHGARTVCLDSEADLLDSRDSGNPFCPATAEHLAYIMYTSGSTGTPKGVAVPHRGVVRLLFGIDYVRLDAGRSILQIASAAFDASTFEIWGALLHGGRCVLFPGRIPALDLLGRVLREQQIDTLWLTAALFNTVIDDSPEILTDVRQLVIGGEALSVTHVRRGLERLPATTIVNGYGPTEATTFTCCYRIPCQIPTDARSIPIGKPIGNTSVYLLDAYGRLVPVGVPGELHVGGPGVARGYWNQPELTADRFIPDRFSTVTGARLYRTGDLARHLPDGNIEFLGRLDEQVKIRGFRIEPGEIEAALHRHPAVREAVVVAREEAGNVGRRLVAYVVLRSDDAGTPRELRNFLRGILPEYMVPSAYVVLDELPLSPNGKVDRRRLPAPSDCGLEEERVVTAPRTPTEERLAALFAELLGRDRVGVDEDFFQLGGHSLLAMQAAARARPVLGVDLPLTSLFETPTVAGLADSVAARGRSRDGEQTLSPRSLLRASPVPLMASQLWRWDCEVHRKTPGNAVSSVSRAYCLRGPLDVGALRDSLQALVERHEALRTTFRFVDGVPMQFVGTSGRLDLPVVDLSTLPADPRLPEAQRLFDNEATRSFDLAEDLMLRPLLLRLDHEQYVLVLTFDHIVIDAWSLGIVHRELSALYGAISTGAAPALPRLPIQPADFAVWERQHLLGEVGQRHLTYWKKHLQGAPPAPDLPSDGPHPASGDFRSVRQSRVIEANLADALRRLAREEGCTLPMTLLAALNVLLYESTGQADILVGALLAARFRPEVEGLIGLFSKRVILRTDLSGRPTFRELLGRVREVATGAYLHLDVSQEVVFPERGFDHPVHWSNIPVFFNYIELEHNLTLPGLTVSSLERPTNIVWAHPILYFHILEQEHDLLLRIGSRHGLYSLHTAREFLDDFHALLRRLAGAPSQPLSREASRAQSRINSVVLDELPLPPNGKVNRRHLRAPRTPTEERLAALFAELLGRDQVGVDEDFFELGGHSLLAMQAAARARQVLGIDLPLTSLFETATVAGLAEAVAARDRSGEGEQPLRPVPFPRTGPFPLMASQLRRWEICRNYGHRPLVNTSRAYCLRGPLAVGALREALVALVERHEALRTNFRVVDGVPMQFVGSAGSLDVPVVDLSTLPAGQRLPEAQRLFDGEAVRNFDLAEDLMVRPLLVRLDHEQHVLILICDHIAMDAWSLGIVHRDLSALYGAISTGAAPALPRLPLQPADFAVWERQHLQGEAAQRHVAYWKKHLAGAPLTIPLPADGPLAERGDFRSIRLSLGIPPSVVDALRELGRQERCTLPMTLFAALNVMMYEFTGQDDIVVGAPLVARNYPEVEDLIGLFSKRVLLRTDLSGNPSFRKLLGRVREVMTGAYSHLDVSQEIVFPERGVVDHPAHWTNVPMNFNSMEGLSHFLSFPGLVVSNLERAECFSTSVGLNLIEQQTGLVVRFLSRHGHYSPERIKYYLERFGGILQRVTSAPSQPLSREASRAQSRINSVVLDELPLPPNSKVNRRHLRAPRTPTEEKLAALFAELLGRDRVGVDEDFFELGGHSLLAMQAVSRARQLLGVDVPLTSLFETPTVAGLAATVAARGRSDHREPPLLPLPLPATARSP